MTLLEFIDKSGWRVLGAFIIVYAAVRVVGIVLVAVIERVWRDRP